MQTHGEFTVRAKRRRGAALSSSTASQCGPANPRAASLQDKVTQVSKAMEEAADPASSLTFSLSVDIPDLELCLWPLRNLTSGTQTSPRIAPPLRTLSLDSEPGLVVGEEVGVVGREGEEVGVKVQHTPQLGDQGRQFSTETQTEFDLFLDSIGVPSRGVEGLGGMEPLEMTSMETQTQEAEQDFLLFANNCTQTELERLFSPPCSGSSLLSSETQTQLTGLQGARAQAGLVQSVLEHASQQDMYTNIETQTCDLQDLLSASP